MYTYISTYSNMQVYAHDQLEALKEGKVHQGMTPRMHAATVWNPVQNHNSPQEAPFKDDHRDNRFATVIPGPQ